MKAYICLQCGSANGECIPTDTTQENWYWRTRPHGRIGPFCSMSCSQSIANIEKGTFTLQEWERLRFLKWRLIHEEAAV